MPNAKPAAMMKSAAAYATQRAEIARLLQELDTQLAAHAAEQARKPDHWGYVGDLTHIAELLSEAVGERR